jgi:16S rRNA (uracil1498-N3)-methyltransferase
VFWTFLAAGQPAGDRLVIGGADGHHLARVLRVRPGERGVAVATGREYDLEVLEVRAAEVVCQVTGDRPAGGEPALAITLLQATLPNPDFDAVLEAGTAMGIHRFIPVRAERSVARPAASRIQRWQAIIKSAAEQSHRGALPLVLEPLPLGAALEQVAGSPLLVLDPSARAPLERTDASRVAVAIGPEGGWTPGELAAMRGHGGVPVSLGPRILRARLAPIVAAAILVR